MKNANTREFLECIDHQDATLRYKNRYFFVNGCSVEYDNKLGKTMSVSIEISEVDGENYMRATQWIATITKPTIDECINEFTNIPIIDGKTFWELENELEWI